MNAGRSSGFQVPTWPPSEYGYREGESSARSSHRYAMPPTMMPSMNAPSREDPYFVSRGFEAQSFHADPDWNRQKYRFPPRIEHSKYFKKLLALFELHLRYT
jgi:hypothetical protein